MPSLSDLINAEQAQRRAQMTHEPFTPYQPAVEARQGIGQWAQGVGERSSLGGMLGAMASEAQRYQQMPPEELAGSFGPSGGSGLVGMFAGRGAKTANLAELARAEEMAKAGVPDPEIWKQTGWTLNTPDKVPRFEIPDYLSIMRASNIPKQKSNIELANQYLWEQGVPKNRDIGSADILVPEQLKAEAFQYAKMKQANTEIPTIPMADALSHKYLYEAYPETSGIKFSQEIGADMRGTYNPDKDTITAGGGSILGNVGDIKSTTLHELQHAIQQREGFARGGSPDTSAGVGMTKDNTMDFARKAYEQAHQTSGDPLLEELMGGAKKWEELTPREQLGWIDQGRMAAYRNLAGEAEARLTQARMAMTPEQRLAQYPYEPEYFQQATGVPLQDLIVRQENSLARLANQQEYQ